MDRTDQEIVNNGEDARQFKEYITNSEYFNRLLDNSKNIIKEAIYALKPSQQMEFTVFKANLHGIEHLFDMVDNDLYHAEQAALRLQGGDKPQKGIL